MNMKYGDGTEWEGVWSECEGNRVNGKLKKALKSKAAKSKF